jgi:hypothetical protein
MPCQLFSGEVLSSATAIFVSFTPRRFFVRAHLWSAFAPIPGAAKLDVIRGIVNMSRTYPALRVRRYSGDATM